jgi:hypothetical protein
MAYQNSGTSDDGQDLAQARADLGRANGELVQLRADFERLALVCRALWSLQQESSGLTEQDLMRRVDEIDLLDGHLDGRLRPGVSACPACGRNNNARQRRCIYCEAPLQRLSAFD